MYRPQTPFNVAMKILIPEWKTIKGVKTKIYPNPEDVSDDLVFFGSFRTFGGTETTINDVYSVENTATVETWFRPEIKADCRIFIPAIGDIYEVVGTPENIEMRNQFLKFKVRGIGGKT